MRQLLNGKGLERIVLDNDITANDLLSEYKIRGPFASIFSFRLNSFHLTQLTKLDKTDCLLWQKLTYYPGGELVDFYDGGDHVHIWGLKFRKDEHIWALRF